MERKRPGQERTPSRGLNNISHRRPWLAGPGCVNESQVWQIVSIDTVTWPKYTRHLHKMVQKSAEHCLFVFDSVEQWTFLKEVRVITEKIVSKSILLEPKLFTAGFVSRETPFKTYEEAFMDRGLFNAENSWRYYGLIYQVAFNG